MDTSSSEKKFKIFLLDDDDFLVNMYATKFTSKSIDVDVFKSGELLLEKLRNSDVKVDLVLMDIVIPGMDGIATLEKIREEKLIPNVPIVMLTNQSDESDIARTSNLGVSGYIVKAAATPTEVVDEILKILKK